MAHLFFYGTLCHRPLLSVVLGRDPGEGALVAARLPGHAAHWADGHAFPIISAAQNGETQGLLLCDPTPEDVARLDFYEGGFGYHLRPVTVQTADGPVAARVYFPDPGLWQPGAPWSLAEWQDKWGDLTVRAAQEFMAHAGRLHADEARALYPFMTARAWAQRLAQAPAPATRRHAARPDDLTVTLHDGGYRKFFGLQPFDVRFRRFDGTQSPQITREAFVAYDAALVLPYDPATDHVLLIEQLRFGPILRTDPQPWVFEPVAGLVDAGEDPADCARREAQEEAGVTLRAVEKIAGVYPSPGYSSEFFHCYLGLADLSGRDGHVGGLSAEAEDIRSHVLPLDTALALTESGEINAAPLLMMLLWTARHRDRLRSGA